MRRLIKGLLGLSSVEDEGSDWKDWVEDRES